MSNKTILKLQCIKSGVHNSHRVETKINISIGNPDLKILPNVSLEYFNCSMPLPLTWKGLSRKIVQILKNL